MRAEMLNTQIILWIFFLYWLDSTEYYLESQIIKYKGLPKRILHVIHDEEANSNFGLEVLLVHKKMFLSLQLHYMVVKSCFILYTWILIYFFFFEYKIEKYKTRVQRLSEPWLNERKWFDGWWLIGKTKSHSTLK